jgi:hypothetical protein
MKQEHGGLHPGRWLESVCRAVGAAAKAFRPPGLLIPKIFQAGFARYLC